ncbi:MAG: site-specific DNA-methyltransferase [Rickettsiales bacterium]|nr:site-specific DNA-methyltransferase [Rickettsiales bacterium]
MPTLDFKGKQFIYSHHHNVPFRELKIDYEKSLPKDGKTSLDDNLIIHGDNLHALKALMPKYAGKIKCIYIDPPYNTGNEGWCYNDNVNSPLMKEWLKKNANPVDREDLQRHDKWLCMMYPRLKLLHELLADDGVIFVSIDDNEVHHLRAIMDEIFGEENFKNYIQVKRGTKNIQAQFDEVDKLTSAYEFVIVYSKSSRKLPQIKITLEQSKSGGWNNHWRGTDRPTMRYEIFGIKPKTGQWRWSEDRSILAIKNYENLIKEIGENFTQDEIDNFYLTKIKELGSFDLLRLSKNGKPEHYIPPSETSTPNDKWDDIVLNGTKDLEKLGLVFDNSKNYQLVKRIVKWITNKNDIILDSFAGSGTTAHAVLDLNREDGGNRKFILVEMENYANEITAERVRRVIKGIKTAKDENLKNGLGGSFTFCELGDEFNIEKILTGEALPKYEALANYVFYTATGKSLEVDAKSRPDYFVGETDLYEIYLIYQPDIAFLRSNESALNSKIVEIIASKESKKQKLVFATAKYMGQNELSEHKITFCQLPYAIHKIVAR